MTATQYERPEKVYEQTPMVVAASEIWKGDKIGDRVVARQKCGSVWVELFDSEDARIARKRLDDKVEIVRPVETPESEKASRIAMANHTLAGMVEYWLKDREESRAKLAKSLTSFTLDEAIEANGKAQWFEWLGNIVERDGMTHLEAAPIVLERAQKHLESYYGSHRSTSGAGNLMADAETVGAAHFVREVKQYIERVGR